MPSPRRGAGFDAERGEHALRVERAGVEQPGGVGIDAQRRRRRRRGAPAQQAERRAHEATIAPNGAVAALARTDRVSAAARCPAARDARGKNGAAARRRAAARRSARRRSVVRAGTWTRSAIDGIAVPRTRAPAPARVSRGAGSRRSSSPSATTSATATPRPPRDDERPQDRQRHGEQRAGAPGADGDHQAAVGPDHHRGTVTLCERALQRLVGA